MAQIDTALGQQGFDVPQRQRKRTYISTTSRVTAGEELKHRNRLGTLALEALVERVSRVLGYWGVFATFATDYPGDACSAVPTCRHAQDSLMEMALPFEPTQFAPVSEEWEARLFYD